MTVEIFFKLLTVALSILVLVPAFSYIVARAASRAYFKTKYEYVMSIGDKIREGERHQHGKG